MVTNYKKNATIIATTFQTSTWKTGKSVWTIAWTGLARYLTCTLSTRPLLLKPSSLAWSTSSSSPPQLSGSNWVLLQWQLPHNRQTMPGELAARTDFDEKNTAFQGFWALYVLIFFLHQDLWGHGAEPGENECFVHYNLKGTAQVCDKLPKNTAFTNTHKIQIPNSGQLWGEQVQVWRGQRVPEMLTRVIFL